MNRIEIANQRLKRLGVIGRRLEGIYNKRAKTKELAIYPMYLRSNIILLILGSVSVYITQDCLQKSLQELNNSVNFGQVCDKLGTLRREDISFPTHRRLLTTSPYQPPRNSNNLSIITTGTEIWRF